MSTLNLPKHLPYNQVTNLQLYCGKDGILRVKNGMTLEEYLNQPYLVKNRKSFLKKTKKKENYFIMVDEHYWSIVSMPHSA